MVLSPFLVVEGVTMVAGGAEQPHSAFPRLLVHSWDFKLFCWYFTHFQVKRQRAWQRHSLIPTC